jgi:hypothetical protein
MHRGPWTVNIAFIEITAQYKSKNTSISDIRTTPLEESFGKTPELEIVGEEDGKPKEM